MAMDFDHLNDDCIRHILNCIPLQGLIPLRIICPRWRYIISSMCRIKRAIKFSGSLLAWNKPNTVALDELIFGFRTFSLVHPSTMVTLSNWFTNLAELKVHVNGNSQEILPILLGCTTWSESLICLEITCQGGSFMVHPAVVHKVNVLEAMPLLSQLESFTFVNYSAGPFSIMQHLGSKLKKLTLRNLNVNISKLKQLVIDNDLTGITHLKIETITCNILGMQVVLMVGDLLKDIQSLDVKFTPLIPISDVLNNLAHLEHLTDLKLRPMFINAIKSLDLSVTLACPSIRSLHLYQSKCNPVESRQLFTRIQILFPNLTELVIYGSEYMIGKYPDDLLLCQMKHEYLPEEWTVRFVHLN